METNITIRPDEFDESFLKIVRNLIKTKKVTNITINLSDRKPVRSLRKESPSEVKARIELAVTEIESGKANLISFSAQEFESFAKSLSK